MKLWTREDTKDWISSLESRIEDISYYLTFCLQWCDENEVYSDKIKFICCFMTVVWVCHLRNETVSKQELFEILDIKNWNEIEDMVFDLNPDYEFMDLDELLESIVSTFI